MNHSCIDRYRDRAGYFLRIKQSIEHLTCRAYFAPDVIGLCKSRIADMMVNAGSFFCSVEVRTCKSKSVSGAYIAGNKKIVLFVTVQLCFDLIHTVNMSENRFRIIQINIYLNFRIIGFYI